MRSLIQALHVAGKEWRLLSRNPHGLVVLFLMPAAFILVMSFALQNTLTSAAVELPATGWLVEGAGPIAGRFADGWIERNGGRRYTSQQQLRQALRAREVEAGISLQPGWLDETGKPRPERMELWLGNAIRPAVAGRLRVEIGYAMLQLQMKSAAAAAGPFASILLDSASSNELLPASGSVATRFLHEIDSGRKMTAVQQSVPAWLIFGMFFVVIPIAGVLIQERSDGTLLRLHVMGVGPAAILGGKLLAFMGLNAVQLLFMLLVGRWLVPLLGGDALQLDIAAGWFLSMVVSTSIAAVGLALLIAAHTRSFDHAAALGAGVNVLLGAVAGIMVPRTVMPQGMQKLSEWSPMGWALDGMQAVFLGAPDAQQVVPKVLLLLGFGALCLIWTWGALRRSQPARQR